jgi:hypothetical protein
MGSDGGICPLAKPLSGASIRPCVLPWLLDPAPVAPRARTRWARRLGANAAFQRARRPARSLSRRQIGFSANNRTLQGTKVRRETKSPPRNGETERPDGGYTRNIWSGGPPLRPSRTRGQAAGVVFVKPSVERRSRGLLAHPRARRDGSAIFVSNDVSNRRDRPSFRSQWNPCITGPQRNSSTIPKRPSTIRQQPQAACTHVNDVYHHVAYTAGRRVAVGLPPRRCSIAVIDIRRATDH